MISANSYVYCIGTGTGERTASCTVDTILLRYGTTSEVHWTLHIVFCEITKIGSLRHFVGVLEGT